MRLTTTQWIVNIGDKTFWLAKRVSVSDTPPIKKEKKRQETQQWGIVYYFLPGYCYWNKECKTLWPGTNHARADDKKVVGSLSRLHRARLEGGCRNVSDQASIGVLSTMNNILYIHPLINPQGANHNI